jgi:hypothetical protein
MFQTLTRALNMFSVRNMYYNTLDKRLLARHISKYSVSRIGTLCCNVEKKNCEGSSSGSGKRCQSLHIESNETNFKCEITNLPPRPGDVDCNCKLMCMTKKSETMTITESKKNN